MVVFIQKHVWENYIVDIYVKLFIVEKVFIDGTGINGMTVGGHL